MEIRLNGWPLDAFASQADKDKARSEMARKEQIAKQNDTPELRELFTELNKINYHDPDSNPWYQYSKIAAKIRAAGGHVQDYVGD